MAKYSTQSIKSKLAMKLCREYNIVIDPDDMHSFRRNGFGTDIISWVTIKNNPSYKSFDRMSDCLKYPLKIERGDFGKDREITIAVNIDKVIKLLC